MKISTYTLAREHLATLLEEARREEVIIQRRKGEKFSVTLGPQGFSPFDVAPVKTKATTLDILEAIRESRERG